MLFRRFDDLVQENFELRKRLDRVDRLIPEFDASILLVDERQTQCWSEVHDQKSRIIALEYREEWRQARRMNPLSRSGRGRHSIATMVAQGRGARAAVEEGDSAEAPILVDSDLSE